MANNKKGVAEWGLCFEAILPLNVDVAVLTSLDVQSHFHAIFTRK